MNTLTALSGMRIVKSPFGLSQLYDGIRKLIFLRQMNIVLLHSADNNFRSQHSLIISSHFCSLNRLYSYYEVMEEYKNLENIFAVEISA